MKSQKAMLKSVTAVAITELETLREAVRNLYYSAVWTADRPVDATTLWTAVRDAAGFQPGNSPKPIPFDGIQVSYSTDRLRQIGHLVSAKKGREFGTNAARALLLLYGQDLVDRLDATVRQFLEEKLS